jgi:antitoxin ParD1/3/4
LLHFLPQFAAIENRGYACSMRTTMNLSLPVDLKRWVDDQVKSGGYGTASEYLRDMLRRARERQTRRRIDATLVEAVESGADTVMDDADWTSIMKSARAEAAKRAKGRQ